MPKISFNKPKSFWARIWNREFLVFLFLFIMSAAFWVLMTFNENFDRDIKIPVQLINVPSNAILLDSEKDTITVNIRAHGSEFFYRTFNPIGNIVIDFSQYKQSDKVFVSNTELQKLVKLKLGKTITIVSVKSDGLTFRYNYGEHKRLPVRFRGRIGTKSDKEIILKPDSVEVYAQSNVLRKLKEIDTVDDSLEIKEEQTSTFALEKIRGVKCKPSCVSVVIKPLVYAENTITVPVECINLPPGKKMTLFPPRVSITYVVDVSKHNLVEKDQFQVIADYNDISDLKEQKCKFKLVKTPSFVKRAKLSCDGTKYLIEER